MAVRWWLYHEVEHCRENLERMLRLLQLGHVVFDPRSVIVRGLSMKSPAGLVDQ